MCVKHDKLNVKLIQKQRGPDISEGEQVGGYIKNVCHKALLIKVMWPFCRERKTNNETQRRAENIHTFLEICSIIEMAL